MATFWRKRHLQKSETGRDMSFCGNCGVRIVKKHLRGSLAVQELQVADADLLQPS
jgi:hypothetical protein